MLKVFGCACFVLHQPHSSHLNWHEQCFISSLVSFSTIVSLWFFHNDRAHVTHLFISIFVKFLLWRVGFVFDLRIHKRLTLLYNNLYFVPLCLLTRSSSLKHVIINTEETCKLPLKYSYIVSIFFLSFLTWTKVECEYCGIINWCELYFPSAQGTRAVPHKPLIYTLQMKNVVTRRQATCHFLQLKILTNGKNIEQSESLSQGKVFNKVMSIF